LAVLRDATRGGSSTRKPRLGPQSPQENERALARASRGTSLSSNPVGSGRARFAQRSAVTVADDFQRRSTPQQEGGLRRSPGTESPLSFVIVGLLFVGEWSLIGTAPDTGRDDD
jgi:hypothetical protein